MHNPHMSLRIDLVPGVAELAPASWDALGDGTPFLSHAFLDALEKTGCVGAGTGWHPCHLVVREGERLLAAMPLYAKTHSYGEYVFDWAWADAFERHGMAYYPKLVCAVPFTPITGPRLLGVDAGMRRYMLDALAERLLESGWSSAHILFPDETSAQAMKDAGWLRRDGVQFCWENEGYGGFDDFLATLSHDKRKKIRQERRRVAESGVRVRRLVGSEIGEADWAFFHHCYVNTYYEHRSTPYLNEEFFIEIGRRMPQHLLLVVAERNGRPIAAALNFHGRDRDGVQRLYGRYWGVLEHVPGLHFELCYYQAQEFCIEQGIRYFEGGAQGEHKLARGFRPRPTCSYHRIAHPDFAAAIERMLRCEAGMIGIYRHELEERVPFRKIS
jgi:predicted N-acyltransferase